MMLTPEREKEIRKWKWNQADREMLEDAKDELMAEIDRLREALKVSSNALLRYASFPEVIWIQSDFKDPSKFLAISKNMGSGARSVLDQIESIFYEEELEE